MEAMLSQQVAGCRQLTPHNFVSTQLSQPSKRLHPQLGWSRVVAAAERYAFSMQALSGTSNACMLVSLIMLTWQ